MTSQIFLGKYIKRHIYNDPTIHGNMFDNIMKDIDNDIEQYGNVNYDKKLKGNIWEVFSLLWLIGTKVCKNVWRITSTEYNPIPQKIAKKLNVSDTNDSGIDLVGELKSGKYIAIQCKYRSNIIDDLRLPWKEISTFVGLCRQTGPWEKIAISANYNCMWPLRIPQIESDRIIQIDVFRATTKTDWANIFFEEIDLLNKLYGVNSNKEVQQFYSISDIVVHTIKTGEKITTDKLRAFNNTDNILPVNPNIEKKDNTVNVSTPKQVKTNSPTYYTLPTQKSDPSANISKLQVHNERYTTDIVGILNRIGNIIILGISDGVPPVLSKTSKKRSTNWNFFEGNIGQCSSRQISVQH
jgi:hypothetical protein